MFSLLNNGCCDYRVPFLCYLLSLPDTNYCAPYFMIYTFQNIINTMDSKFLKDYDNNKTTYDRLTLAADVLIRKEVKCIDIRQFCRLVHIVTNCIFTDYADLETSIWLFLESVSDVTFSTETDSSYWSFDNFTSLWHEDDIQNVLRTMLCLYEIIINEDTPEIIFRSAISCLHTIHCTYTKKHDYPLGDLVQFPFHVISRIKKVQNDHPLFTGSYMSSRLMTNYTRNEREMNNIGSLFNDDSYILKLKLPPSSIRYNYIHERNLLMDGLQKRIHF